MPDSTDLKEPQTLREKRLEAINGIFQIAQFGCLAFADFADAGAIGLHGPPLADELTDLADKNKAVASKVDLLIEVGPYAGIIAAGLPFVVQILCNHGYLKTEHWANAGVVSAESLEYQMKTTIMKQQMVAMEKQKAAEEELRQMRESMEEKEKDSEEANAG